MIKVDVKKKLRGIEKDFLLNICFEIKKGELVSLYGKSGSGKTTTLRCLAGLERPEEGEIVVDETVWFSSDKKIFLPPQKRSLGMVFQGYALFPNKTVYENIVYGIEKRDNKFIEHLIKIAEIYDILNRYPSTLSGGQQQRVALVRAVARKPIILLLDEPLSALDSSIRGKLQDEIKNIHKTFGLTTIIVTHDIQEVIKLSDRIINIDEGRIIKQGSPNDILFGKSFSSKFSIVGDIIDIIKADILYLAIVAVGNNVVQVVITDEELKDLKVGDRVIVASKGFNPIIKKI